MVLIGKISRGSRMDQVYIPKERGPGYEVGASVLINPVVKKERQKLYYYNIKRLEPIKVAIIADVMGYLEGFENVLVAGSFIEEGFNFEDIDIIVVTEEKVDCKSIEGHFREATGVKTHIIAVGFKTLLKGVSTDPLFQMLTSKFVSKKRVIFRAWNKINYKMLDLHLLKSELFIINFEFLTGREKYKLVRNLIAIMLFLDGRKVNAESVNHEIGRYFGKGAVRELKENLVAKPFLARYKRLYDSTFSRIMKGVKSGSKQKQAN